MKKLLIITGPTGVGKTALSLELGKKLSIEIINGDMGQFYTPLTIGTAKPDWRAEPIPHHLFDILDEPKNYTVIEYRKAVQECVVQIQARGNIPVIVGGSLFYIRSLFFPPLENQKIDTTAYAGPVSWEALQEIDPERAAHIHPHDIYRIQRALTVWHQTGNKPSLYTPIYNPVTPECLIIHCSRNKNDIYERIDARVLEMLHGGWEQEARSLPVSWLDFLKIKKIIGYFELITMKDSPERTAIIQQKTRQYAKRQETLWRSCKKDLDSLVTIHELNLTLSPVHLYIDQLLNM